MHRLVTSRLVLRDWTERDVQPMAQVNADPEAMRGIGSGRARAEHETRTAIDRCQAEIEERGFGLFVVELRETGELAGFVGLSAPDLRARRVMRLKTIPNPAVGSSEDAVRLRKAGDRHRTLGTRMRTAVFREDNFVAPTAEHHGSNPDVSR